jgi:hypothetical protein
MRLLIETHLPVALARQLKLREIDTLTLQKWQGGLHRKELDTALLAAANAERRGHSGCDGIS